MATLQIFVVDAPKEFAEQGEIRLLLSTKDGHFPANFEGENELRFDVPIEVRADRSGELQGWGPAVNRQGDGRRFVYLSWLGPAGMFRRLKVYLDLVPGFPGTADAYSVRVQGRDKKGGPACATARLA